MATRSSRRPARQPATRRATVPPGPAEQIQGPGAIAGLQVMELDPRLIKWPEHRISSQYNADASQMLQASMAIEQKDPIVVYKVGDAWMGAGGMHRCMAAVANGAASILAVVRQGNEEDVRRANYVTGLHQERADPLSVAEAFWHDYNTNGLDLATLSEWSGKPPEYVERMLRIAIADPGVKQALGDGLIMQGHAELLAQLDDHEEQRQWLLRLLSERLTVKELGDLMAGRHEQAEQGAAPARGQRRSTKPSTCNTCQVDFEAGAGQTLQVCDNCLAVQERDVVLAAVVRAYGAQLEQTEQALAETPQFVWLAEMIGRLRAAMAQPGKEAANAAG